MSHYGQYEYKGAHYHTAEAATSAEIADFAVGQTADLEAAARWLGRQPEQVRTEMAGAGCVMRHASQCYWPEACRRARLSLLDEARREYEEEQEREEAAAAPPIFDEDGKLTREALESIEEAMSAALEAYDGTAAWRQVHSQIHAHLYGGGGDV